MASDIANCKSFPDWLKAFLIKEIVDIDADTFGDYIESILKDDSSDQQEISAYIVEFLEEVMPRDKALECTEAIMRKYQSTSENGGTTNDAAATVSSPASSKHLDELEAEMRYLVVQTKSSKALNKQQQEAERRRKKRDACTAAALREAGVSGYQGDEAAEAALAVALADSEYFARQNITCSPFQAEGKSAGGKAKARGKSGKDAKEADGADADDEIDLSEIEENQGYGKKEGMKPGSVLDALSTLDPTKFAGSGSSASVNTGVGGVAGGVRKVKRLPTPGDVSSSSTSGYLLLHSRGPGVTFVSPNDADTAAETTATTSSSSHAKTGKGGGRQVSRRMAEVGARAEEKYALQEARRRANLVGIVGGHRLDDMDAFVVFDDNAHKNNGKEPEAEKTSQPAETKQPRVTSGREYLEKQAREQQQQQKPVGATGGQKKHERRRH